MQGFSWLSQRSKMGWISAQKCTEHACGLVKAFAQHKKTYTTAWNIKIANRELRDCAVGHFVKWTNPRPSSHSTATQGEEESFAKLRVFWDLRKKRWLWSTHKLPPKLRFDPLSLRFGRGERITEGAEVVVHWETLPHVERPSSDGPERGLIHHSAKSRLHGGLPPGIQAVIF